jgi:hypothetical protein
MSISKTVDKVTRIIVSDIVIKPLSNGHMLKRTNTRNRKLVKVSDFGRFKKIQIQINEIKKNFKKIQHVNLNHLKGFVWTKKLFLAKSFAFS